MYLMGLHVGNAISMREVWLLWVLDPPTSDTIQGVARILEKGGKNVVIAHKNFRTEAC